MTTPPSFRLDGYGWLILGRGIPGFFSLWLAVVGQALPAGLCLVAAVWMDAAAGWSPLAKKTTRTTSHLQLEGLVDFLCFVCAPAILALALHRTPWILLPAGLFILAGTYRLARFNVEGVDARGRYVGLPVTYNGYLIPLALWLSSHLPAAGQAWLVSASLLLAAAAMASRRFTIPEF